MSSTPVSAVPSVSARQSGRSTLLLGGLLVASALSVLMSFSAWAKDASADGGCPPAGMAMRGGPEGGPMMPFAGPGLDRMLSHLDATAAQKDQIKKITDAAAPDLKSLREQGQALHEQGLKLWTAPKLDAAAAEQLRQKMVAHHEQMSKRMVQLMLDVGQVLTPEQRAKMAQHMQSHHMGPRHGWHPDHAASAPRDN